MDRQQEKIDLFRQTIQRNKKGMEGVKRWLKDQIANGGLTQKEMAKFKYEIKQTEKAIDEIERFLNENDLA
jgi:hypothetical protein